MLKSYIVHYKNKYPFGRVEASDDKLDVYCADGHHRVALRKGGDGATRDMSKELGCLDKHDLCPIPKNTRVFKLKKDDTIGFDEQHNERSQAVLKLVTDDHKILSIEEYKANGFEVDKEGVVTPKAAPVVEPPVENP